MTMSIGPNDPNKINNTNAKQAEKQKTEKDVKNQADSLFDAAKNCEEKMKQDKLKQAVDKNNVVDYLRRAMGGLLDTVSIVGTLHDTVSQIVDTAVNKAKEVIKAIETPPEAGETQANNPPGETQADNV